MGQQAVTLAKAVDYCSAGTVEFIVDAKRNFYFLEMNTRLQVEHPVTELITGLDLVQMMIRVAAGEKLGLAQDDVKVTGWAIEARVYAEDPLRNFMPSIGRLVKYQAPAESDTVRVDTGIEEGSEVSMFYDPLIAKLITYGDTRDQAIVNMNDALDAYYIRGVSHNISFLNALLAHPRFREGRLTTNFIAEEYPHGFHASDVPHEEPQLLIAIAAAIHRAFMDRAAKLGGQLPHHERKVGDDFVVIINREHHPVQVVPIENGYEVSAGSDLYRIRSDWRMGEHLVKAEINDKPICFQLDRVDLYYRLSHRGSQVDALVMTPQASRLAKQMPEKTPPDLSRFLLSPMPGLLVRLNINKGDEIKAGEELAVVEAMKMENSLRASEDIIIAKIFAKQGDTLAVDQPILEFE
jgi:propionyl-CoA carboxylase alpha chain